MKHAATEGDDVDREEECDFQAYADARWGDYVHRCEACLKPTPDSSLLICEECINKRVPLKFREGDHMQHTCNDQSCAIPSCMGLWRGPGLNTGGDVVQQERGSDYRKPDGWGLSPVTWSPELVGEFKRKWAAVTQKGSYHSDLVRDNCRVARNRGRAEGIAVVVLLVAVALVVWWLVGLVL